MNRFLRSSLPCLLDSTVRSSLYPSSSVLSTLPPLRHFSNKSQEHLRNVWLSGLRDPYIRMVGDWETLMLRYHDYDPYYIDPRVVYVSNNRDPKVTSYKNITVFQHTEVTSYKNITVFDVDSIVDAEIPLHIFDSAVPVLSCLYGVKIETIAIFQQMTRFQFPMFIFIDDIELEGADPWNFFDQVKSKLNHRCAAIQVPLRSIDDCYIGFVDLVKLKASYFPSKKSSRSRFFDRLANKLKGYFFCSQTPD
ncbi:putative P-loop containing nucleoside triphosphate hydrolase [Medicago truncatula]|uniref:Putative P-loop containing nucleoside triphosphate hydrolase n=1 Tax=Medicago truncatula TaxID=3880 RepID=A0A396GRM4_MEDTR|nr:putative P-loop containing nucleoside triphosphate hydrolase [Medicago truncatula]